ncbi:MAG: imidazoleglycerol-phosphate dehydratase HisB [Solobacterium sp.]|jgi:imidazoleglycerol-phosphate dehydratase|nr:imidazoleglycerol-phosphate dehydratase HisB [Solobacterium sp.]MCH4049657.1 imidazoleglycerol-phosphate dehydratase HisB [Solobacterium sp.]MCH4073342.1 imidazoleglycerol-phosphate dehydratase HisB [Solobacterium sp.]MCI1313001.1 imidazoleglycerol-phosphate dehydratase HisB [Solobacterium sp.]MCI1345566.1 imidazoleglycerol-phosphate dehydratase HisB [Solobacterium sp.]
MRTASVSRRTKETEISCTLNLDAKSGTDISTGIGFFDHMLELLSFHSGFGMTIKADGDLNVDDHHTVEDCGIVLGKAFRQALGDKKGIARYGFFSCPMDEALANVSLDFSGRPYLVFHCTFTREKIGDLSTEMVEEFFRAFAVEAGLTLHINVPYGTNNHHMAEAVFKAFGHALKEAVRVSGDGVMSSKGVLA